jgi:DNA-binding response OmpR family regulator
LPSSPVGPRALETKTDLEMKTELDSVDSRPIKLLLVDDEPSIQRTVAKSLRLLGFEVQTAAGRQEVELLLPEEINPDVVLLDHSLADESGRDLVPMLRKELPGAKILYFTGEYISPDDAALVDGVVQKPILKNALVDRIRRII